MKKKKKRKLKRWVRVTLWLMCVGILTGLLILSLKGVGGSSNTQSLPLEGEMSEGQRGSTDSVLVQRLWDFIQSPQRLDSADIAIVINNLDSRTPVINWHGDQLMPPASCMKLLTATAALTRLGIDHNYVEQVAIHGSVNGSTLDGDLIIQTDDDPIVETLEPLVQAVRDRGITEIRGDLVLDLLRRDTLRAHPTASWWDIPYNRTPVLLKGEEYIRRHLSYLFAQKGIHFLRQPLFHDIRLQGLDYRNNPVRWRMAVNQMMTESTVLKTMKTPISDVIIPMLIHSSNIKADALYYHINHVWDRIAGDGGAPDNVVYDFIMEDMAYPDFPCNNFVINDGSGLSPQNMVNADFLMAVLQYAWQDPDIRRLYLDHALASPGDAVRRGSLLSRMSAPQFRGHIFCKTGTLTTIGASSLSGYALSPSGKWYAFVIINRNSPVAESRIYQDKICKILTQE